MIGILLAYGNREGNVFIIEFFLKQIGEFSFFLFHKTMFQVIIRQYLKSLIHPGCGVLQPSKLWAAEFLFFFNSAVNRFQASIKSTGSSDFNSPVSFDTLRFTSSCLIFERAPRLVNSGAVGFGSSMISLDPVHLFGQPGSFYQATKWKKYLLLYYFLFPDGEMTR